MNGIARYSEALEAHARTVSYWLSDEGEQRAAMIGLSNAVYAGDRWNAGKRTTEVRGRMVGQLLGAPTYMVTREICDLIEAGAESFPEMRMSATIVPSTRGFVWLERPLRLPRTETDDGSYGIDLAAFGFDLSVNIENESYGFPGRIIGAAPVHAEPTHIGVGHYMTLPWGGLPMMTGFITWPLGDGWDQNWQPREKYIDGEPRSAGIEQERGRTIRRFIAQFFAFVSQPFTQTTTRGIDRAERRRLARMSGPEHEPALRVVELRRREYQPHQATHPHDVEWSCQWLVRGHWHQYHTRDGLQPRWVAPFIKGPADKPLKQPRADVFAVVR